MFVLMVPAGMPELSSDQDVMCIDKTLVLDLGFDDRGQEEARKVFAERRRKSQGTKSRQADDFIHNIKHR